MNTPMCEDCILHGRCDGCDDAGWYDYMRDEMESVYWNDYDDPEVD